MKTIAMTLGSIPLLLLAFSPPPLLAAEVLAFTGKDLSGWQMPVGEWQTANSVSLNSTNNKKFTIHEGKGILVNGPKGTTRNLMTEMEHGDLEAHIEFVVP